MENGAGDGAPAIMSHIELSHKNRILVAYPSEFSVSAARMARPASSQSPLSNQTCRHGGDKTGRTCPNNGSNGVEVKRHLRYALDQIAERDRNGLEGCFPWYNHLNTNHLLSNGARTSFPSGLLALYCPERINPILF